MFTNDKVNVPILGLVENMAWFTPAELPENKYYIFGKEGAKKLAEERMFLCWDRYLSYKAFAKVETAESQSPSIRTASLARHSRS